MRLRLLLSLVLLSGTLSSALACGTIRLWHEKYFAGPTDYERLDALKFLHCEPIVQQYKGSHEDMALLLSMLDNAMARRGENAEKRERYEALVLKNYFVFGLYKGSDEVVEHSMLQDAIGRLLGVDYFPFNRTFREQVGPSLAIFRPFDTYFTTEEYVVEIQTQVEALRKALIAEVNYTVSATLQGHEGPFQISVAGTNDRILNQFVPTTLNLMGTVRQQITLPDPCVCEWENAGQNLANYVTQFGHGPHYQ